MKRSRWSLLLLATRDMCQIRRAVACSLPLSILGTKVFTSSLRIQHMARDDESSTLCYLSIWRKAGIESITHPPRRPRSELADKDFDRI